MIRKTDEISEATACETNILTASTSDVRFVSSLRRRRPAGCRRDPAWRASPTSVVRRSRATRSDGERLRDVLEVREDEDADRHREELATSEATTT